MNLNVLEVLRRLEGDLTNACNYLKGRCQVDEAKHFLVESSSRARGNGHEQEYHRKFYLSMRKNNWTTLFGGWQNFSDRPIFQKKKYYQLERLENLSHQTCGCHWISMPDFLKSIVIIIVRWEGQIIMLSSSCLLPFSVCSACSISTWVRAVVGIGSIPSMCAKL